MENLTLIPGPKRRLLALLNELKDLVDKDRTASELLYQYHELGGIICNSFSYHDKDKKG